MSPLDASRHDEQRPPDHAWSRGWLVLLGFFILAGLFLFTEHRAHVLGALIYLPLLLCLLMHLFMHGGHHGRDRHHGHGDREGRSGADGKE